MADRDGPKDYYGVLGVGRDATPEDIKRAYRKVAFDLHPDRNPGNADAVVRFKEASEAYQVLSDPAKRQRYDRGDDVGLFGASDAWEMARRRIQRLVIDPLRNLHRTTQGGTNP